METERVSYRWWVLVNTFLIFTVAFGMGWTYIVMLVSAILQDLGLDIADWGTLWSAISFGTVVFAIIGGALGDRFGIRLTVGLGVFFMGGFLALRGTASSFATLYAWMFLFGVALAVTFANVPKALGMWFLPEELGLANGVTRAGYGAGAGLAIIVNGPIGPALGINATNNVFGPGVRANATIGRALRLVMMNVLNTRPGLLDRATLGTPAKYTFCFAENEVDHPWVPLHVERGFRPEDSTVTLYASNTLMGVYNQLASTPEPLLLEFADAVCNLATPNVYGFNETLIVLAAEHAEVLRRSRWSKRQVQEFIVQHARRTVADFKRAARLPGEIQPEDETTWRYVMRRPEDLLIVCAGSQGGSWSACLPGWGNKWTRSITVPIRTGVIP